jgi:hypothetical protein
MAECILVDARCTLQQRSQNVRGLPEHSSGPNIRQARTFVRPEHSSGPNIRQERVQSEHSCRPCRDTEPGSDKAVPCRGENTGLRRMPLLLSMGPVPAIPYPWSDRTAWLPPGQVWRSTSRRTWASSGRSAFAPDTVSVNTFSQSAWRSASSCSSGDWSAVLILA